MSNTTATVVRRAIADCRADEKQAPKSVSAARTDAASRTAARRGSASPKRRPRRTTTIISSSRVKAKRRTLKWKLDASAMRDHFAAHPLFHPHIFSAMCPMRPMRLMRLLVLPVFPITLANCMNPRAEANMAQALNAAANEIGGLKSDIAQIQTDLDSLRSVVAKQDSVINRIAAANNIPRSETALALALKLTSPIGRAALNSPPATRHHQR